LSRPVHLVLIGRDEGGAEPLRERLQRERLEDDVLLAGEVNDAELSRWYAHADLFALFSHYEAFGLVYLEAMAAGLPVLTHAVGATAEVAHTGAVVVPAFDAPAAEAALERLLADDAYRASLGRDAAMHATEHSREAVAARYIGLYRAARRRRMLPAPSNDGPDQADLHRSDAQRPSDAESGGNRAVDHVEHERAPAMVPRPEPVGGERIVVLAKSGALDESAGGVDE